MIMLDLCCGLKGASEAMRLRGWTVITLDIAQEFEPDIIADVQQWSWNGKRPDLIWASPPCQEFNRESMPWSHKGITPNLSIVNACRRIVAECEPSFWIIENVRGAVPYLGEPRAIIAPFYLWGFFPILSLPKLTYHHKESYSSSAKALRAKIPYQLSLALAKAVEYSRELL